MLFKVGLAFASLVLSGLVPGCDAAHGHHHHKDVLDRVMHKAAASSRSSLNATGTLVEPTSEQLFPSSNVTEPTDMANSFGSRV